MMELERNWKMEIAERDGGIMFKEDWILEKKNLKRNFFLFLILRYAILTRVHRFPFLQAIKKLAWASNLEKFKKNNNYKANSPSVIMSVYERGAESYFSDSYLEN